MNSNQCPVQVSILQYSALHFSSIFVVYVHMTRCRLGFPNAAPGRLTYIFNAEVYNFSPGSHLFFFLLDMVNKINLGFRRLNTPVLIITSPSPVGWTCFITEKIVTSETWDPHPGPFAVSFRAPLPLWTLDPLISAWRERFLGTSRPHMSAHVNINTWKEATKHWWPRITSVKGSPAVCLVFSHPAIGASGVMGWRGGGGVLTLTSLWLSFVLAAPQCLGWLHSLLLKQYIMAELSQTLPLRRDIWSWNCCSVP